MAENNATTSEITSASPLLSVNACKLRRKTIRTQITIFGTFVESMEQSPNFDRLQIRMEAIEKYFNEFQQIQTMLELQQPEEEHDAIRNEIENNYYDSMARARGLIRLSNAPIPQLTRDSSNASPNPFNIRGQDSRYKRLPQLNPPTFDGQLESWATFKTRFTSMINRNDDLSDAEKLEYLQSSLTGKAARVINSLEATEANYSDAWELLTSKYDNTRKTILRHWNILENLEPLKNENADSIEDLVDTIQQHLRSLKGLHQDVDNWDCVILSLIMRKISKTLTRQWELTLEDNKLPSYQSLIKFLIKHANCSEQKQGQPVNSNGRQGHKPSVASGRIASGKSNSQAFATTTSGGMKCPMCQEEHGIYQCKNFTDLPIEDRIKTAMRASLCLNCLQGKHKTRTCPSKGRCRICQKQHHTTVHRAIADAPATAEA